jgi:hypothetical protein
MPVVVQRTLNLRALGWSQRHIKWVVDTGDVTDCLTIGLGEDEQRSTCLMVDRDGDFQVQETDL